MTAIAKAFSHPVSTESPEVDIFKTIALFCGAGLLVSSLLIAGLAYLPLEPQTLNVIDWM